MSSEKLKNLWVANKGLLPLILVDMDKERMEKKDYKVVEEKKEETQ